MKYLRKPFRYSYSNFVLLIIAINAALLFLTFTNRRLNFYLGLVPGLVLSKKFYWQFFTYQFMHGDFGHLFFNMLTLFIFGTSVERKIGSKEFLLYYLLIGTVCGILSYFVYISVGAYYVTLIGASGSIFGILLLYSVLFPKSVIYLWAVVPIPAPLLIVGYAVIEIIGIFSATDNVAHATHFFGFLAGWFYIKIRFGISPLKIWNS